MEKKADKPIIVKRTYSGEIDLIEYFRKCLIRELNKDRDRETYYIEKKG